VDPNLVSIILSVVANGLTTLISSGVAATGSALDVRRAHDPASQKTRALSDTLRSAIEETSDTMPWQGSLPVEVVCLFLRTPEVESMARQLFAVQLLPPAPHADLALIKRRFLASLAHYVRRPEGEIATQADALFGLLAQGCERTLAQAIDAGSIAAHEATSTLRHRMLMDELDTLGKAVALLAAPLDIDAIIRFEQAYREQVGRRHGTIAPAHIDTALRYPIDDVFVPPHILRSSDGATRPHPSVAMSHILSTLYRGIILGHPGGGKSTLSLKVCHDLATRYDERLVAGRQLTPVLVVLRDYAAVKATHNQSILQFIETTANTHYQVPPPPRAFEYLLLNGRAMVIFDGLDELLDTRRRQEIAADVESFCGRYPAAPVLVTSREVGYEQAPLDRGLFEAFRLAPFDDGQVVRYVEQWFALDPDLAPAPRMDRAQAFLGESRSVPDLRSNPLMLGLMCNLYRRENYIPRNRPEVYERCATLLFDRWDRSRSIHAGLPIAVETHVRPLMQYLAYWIYKDAALQAGVTDGQLVETAADYLCPRRYEDREDARHAAQQFIDFCRGRAWVFTDTGTTDTGDRLYQFTHRTFLEYFAAARLVQVCVTPERLRAALQPKIEQREWDMLAQLAFQIMSKQAEDASDVLLEGLIEIVERLPGDERWNVLSFGVRCLHVIVPSPRVVRAIAHLAVDHCVRDGAARMTHADDGAATQLLSRHTTAIAPIAILEDLSSVAPENFDGVAASVEDLLRRAIVAADDDRASVAYALTAELPFLPPEEWDELADVYRAWQPVVERIWDAVPVDRVRRLAARHFSIGRDAVRRHVVSLQDIVAWHGLGSLFRTAASIISRRRAFSVATSTFKAYLVDLSCGSAHDSEDARTIGALLGAVAPPWVSDPDMPDGIELELLTDEVMDLPAPGAGVQDGAGVLSPDARFGLFALLGVSAEIDLQDTMWLLDHAATPLPDGLRALINARQGEPADRHDTIMHGWTADQRAIAEQWVGRAVSFVVRRDSDPEDIDVEGAIDYV